MFARNRDSALRTPADDSIPLTPAQRTAGRRLQASKQEIPHFYLHTSANLSAVAARIKAAGRGALVWDAFFVLAVGRALKRFDRFSRRLEGDRLVRAASDAIGVAIDHDEELYVIPIASPATKTVEQLSDEIRRGADRVRRGDAEARRIRPAVITVTNLGVSNVEVLIPVINPPEVAILGVGRAKPVPVVEDGQIAVQHRATLTLSVDHRVVSGRYAGDFLGAIVEELEAM
jgi:pyruvate dehydrogenase E2 component (dihydrolipoamide acetyltransferase)